MFFPQLRTVCLYLSFLTFNQYIVCKLPSPGNRYFNLSSIHWWMDYLQMANDGSIYRSCWIVSFICMVGQGLQNYQYYSYLPNKVQGGIVAKGGKKWENQGLNINLGWEEEKTKGRITSMEKARRKLKVVDNVSNTKTWFVFVLMAVLDLFVFWVCLLKHVGQTTVPCIDTCGQDNTQGRVK